MNDKIQLAAMGAQYRLTEEQAKGLAERMPKGGAFRSLMMNPCAWQSASRNWRRKCG